MDPWEDIPCYLHSNDRLLHWDTVQTHNIPLLSNMTITSFEEDDPSCIIYYNDEIPSLSPSQTSCSIYKFKCGIIISISNVMTGKDNHFLVFYVSPGYHSFHDCYMSIASGDCEKWAQHAVARAVGSNVSYAVTNVDRPHILYYPFGLAKGLPYYKCLGGSARQMGLFWTFKQHVRYRKLSALKKKAVTKTAVLSKITYLMSCSSLNWTDALCRISLGKSCLSADDLEIHYGIHFKRKYVWDWIDVTYKPKNLPVGPNKDGIQCCDTVHAWDFLDGTCISCNTKKSDIKGLSYHEMMVTAVMFYLDNNLMTRKDNIGLRITTWLVACRHLDPVGTK